MCVAVVIEDKAPTLSELRMMEASNPHGAGIAHPLIEEGKGAVAMRYYKGLTAEQIWEVLDRLPRPILMHYRWATHGPKEARLTHPFVMGERALEDATLVGNAPAVLIHNGVWSNWYGHRPDWADYSISGLFSDTQVAAYVADSKEEILDGVGWATAVARTLPDGEVRVTMRGRWMPYNKNYYSNLSWIEGK